MKNRCNSGLVALTSPSCGRAFCFLQVRWTLAVYEFLDTDQFSNLDTLMLQLAPGQCLLSLDADAAKGKPRGDMAKVRIYVFGDKIV